VDEEDVAGIGVEDLRKHRKQKRIGKRFNGQRLCNDETNIGEGVLDHGKKGRPESARLKK
jgi:hypothetical protein